MITKRKFLNKEEEEEEKEKEKKTTPKTAKAQHRGRGFITTIKSVMNNHIYIYTHKQNQNSPPKIKYSRLAQRTKETKNYICQQEQD